MSGGIVLVIFGAWVAMQVLGGDALDRLGITTASETKTEAPPQNVDPDTKIPNQDPNKPYLRDPNNGGIL